LIRINYVELKTYVHATEDERKVLDALFKIIPGEFKDKIKINKQIVKGYYGNPITIVQIVLRNKYAIELLRRLGSLLDDVERSVLRASFNLRYDSRSNRFFIRLDKQDLFRGRAVVSDGDDVVHIMISFKGRGGAEDANKLLKELGIV